MARGAAGGVRLQTRVLGPHPRRAGGEWICRAGPACSGRLLSRAARRRLTAFECAAGPPRKRARFSSVSNRRVDQRGRTAPEYRRGGPEFGMMSPARFMPVAEHCGLIVPVRRWALAPVCLQLRGLRVVGLAPTRAFANLVGAPASPGGPGRWAAGVSAPVTSRHL